MSDPRGDRLTATPAGVTLGALETIPDGGARNFVLQMKAGRFHGFVVRQGDAVHGHVDRCPHAGVPLTATLDDYLTPSGELIACSWHGALFRIDDGLCVGGPCVGQRLTPWPVAVVDGAIVTTAGRAAEPAAPPPVEPRMMNQPDLPPDNGAAPSIDKQGQVHGSGVGAGGGQDGEDMASDPAAGDGYPLTGAEDAVDDEGQPQ